MGVKKNERCAFETRIRYEREFTRCAKKGTERVRTDHKLMRFCPGHAKEVRAIEQAFGDRHGR